MKISIPSTCRLVLCAVVSAFAMAFPASCRKAETPAPKPLLCYVGGTMKPVLEVLAERYKQQTGQAVELDAADSGTCLIKIETSKQGDLYVAHDPFPAAAEKKGLATKTWQVASLSPVIVVQKGNPLSIRSLADMAVPPGADGKRLKLGLTDAQYSTLGHIAPVMFDKANLRQAIEANVATRMRSGGAVANAVAMGNLDVAIVWNAVAHLRREKLDIVEIAPLQRLMPGVDTVSSATYGTIDMGHIKVGICVLGCSARPEQAKAFAEFLASPAAREEFAKFGFGPSKPAAGPVE